MTRCVALSAFYGIFPRRGAKGIPTVYKEGEEEHHEMKPRPPNTPSPSTNILTNNRLGTFTPSRSLHRLRFGLRVLSARMRDW